MTSQTLVFSLDAQSLERIEQKFQEKVRFAEARKDKLFHVFQQPLTEEEAWALKYVYAYMPVNDMADYDGELFLSHVRRALDIRKRVPWGERVPDHLFLHFVLPYRINTENIEDFRGIIFDELAGRTAKLSMADAILETNYWCHEKATYIGSDLRTISPLTMIRNARGRCGEESTLAVAALRSIGIPARQVYTPRWAHSDSNHAWVEAWADGQWYYIGACEPEAGLNQGWFTPPARRAMLINTRIFADYPGPEDITLNEKGFTEINLLENYAPTRTIRVKVKDMQGEPVPGASLRFELYNTAEFYPIAEIKTDVLGEAAFKTGCGDLLIRAVSGGQWSEVLFKAQDSDQVELVLDSSEQPSGSVDFDMVPPPEGEAEAAIALPEEKIQEHSRRLEEGTKIRNGYEDTFLSEEEAYALAHSAGLPRERVWDILQMARGNSREIAAFLEERSEKYGEWPLRLLESMNEKDLIDTFRQTLDDHLIGAHSQRGSWAEDTFVEYILCPRVSYEMVVPYRSVFQNAYSEEEVAAFRKEPSALVRQLEQSYAYYEDLPNLKGKGNPVGTFSLMKGDPQSLDILFVAVCRSLGIPARLHPSEQKPQYLGDRGWENAMFSLNASRNQEDRSWGMLQLLRDEEGPQEAPTASYGENFSFARLEDGVYKTLIYPHGSTDVYSQPYEVEPGAYRLTTGIRLKDGAVRVRFIYFTVRAGDTTEVVLTYRETVVDIPVLGKLAPGSVLTRLDGSEVVLEALLGAEGAIAAWIEPEREPTKHLIRELGELAEPLDKLGLPIVLLIGDTEWNASFDPAAYPKLPVRTIFVRDSSYASLSGFIPNPATHEAGYPHLFVLDSQDQIRYSASGYKIGTGKEALQIAAAISQSLNGSE
ncbi:MAG TPA: transglutaminase domain-containing protein [Paenibacillus sp.]|uniref:transglutaminase domain-containing protein n=1 Tax=Paenibacillus TaxID=44249 RepID=UPI000BA08C9C|nr:MULTISPECIES: transglutaminase domain-containing protein [Paenibacillus]OZQ71743.1 transglutaminase [Paenibacillus taichungensis]HBU80691.1 transglutaminase domain-containing protein [Paenibacillus sp.]